MKEFQGNDYLLSSPLAIHLYEDYAKDMPIFDFHCHLSPKEIYEDKPFENIAQAWLGKLGAGDHYKWRLLRQSGVDEELITGNADDYERFLAFARSIPSWIGNPIYEWTHLELKRFFGCDLILNENNAAEIYSLCNEKLKTLTPRQMILHSNVKALFTTDDPVDDLHYHEALAKDKSFPVTVLPCWRPDRFLHIGEMRFLPALHELEALFGHELLDLDALLGALGNRLHYFLDHGCKAADHGLDHFLFQGNLDKEKANEAYQKARSGQTLSEEEILSYESYLLLFLAKEYKAANMVQQYHIGALRNNSRVGHLKHGVDFGYDAVGDAPLASMLSDLLATLEEHDSLPKTIFYCLNEKDYGSLLSILNSFQGQGKGYLQLGAAWWFNDHYEGMKRQLRTLMAGGVLSTFVGMLTDSRSFLSYARHEYFRRILADEVASLVEQGRYPNEEETLGNIIRDICYNNAVAYFGFNEKGK